MNDRAPDVKDPLTAYLAMHIDLINEADSFASVSPPRQDSCRVS
ncbi:hypothetical protein [Stutzerimonas nitrititolerans]|nr:hypothetical protein [Stutzerimonas nitrititolerans]